MSTTTLEKKPPKKASSELKTTAAPKNVPSPVRTGAALKNAPSAAQASTALKKPTPRKRVGKRVPPAPKSGARPLAPAKLAAAVQTMALPQLPQPAPGQAINLGPIVGTGSPTGAFGAGAVDLCEISPSGLVALGGDTFSGNCLRERDVEPIDGPASPASHPERQHNPVRAARSAGTARSTPRPHRHVPGGSQLPAGTVQVFGIDYAFVARIANLQPVDTRLVRIDPSDRGWATVPGSCRDAASWQNFNETQISGYQDPTAMSTSSPTGSPAITACGFIGARRRASPTGTTWQAWGIDGMTADWAWNVDPTPLSGDLWGELSLRLIEGKTVLSGFNASTGNVEVRVTDDVTQVLAP